MADSKTTFSIRDIPDSWVDAAAEGPVGSPGPLVERRRSGRRLPTGTRPDLVTGALTGTASMAAGPFLFGRAPTPGHGWPSSSAHSLRSRSGLVLALLARRCG